PTKAAEGFARSRGVSVDDLTVEEIDGGRYVMALVQETGRPAAEVLAEALPGLIAGIKFNRAMRWNSTNIAFSRPIRWLLALLGETVVPFTYAGIASDRITRGLRPYGSPEISARDAAAYFDHLTYQFIVLNPEKRREKIVEQAAALAAEVGGRIPDDPGLLAEVTNLIEAPTALRGRFEETFLELPRDVLVTVMRDKQRYFAVEAQDGKLLPYFITVRNGDSQHLDKVTHGNEQVLRARFADAQYFYAQDTQKRLEEFLPRLGTLTFQEQLGSMLDKNERVAGLIEPVGDLLGIDATQIGIAQRAAHLAKADLATQMVVEMTSLQGTMGREYALRNDYPQEVADAIFEHWLPRSADDQLPPSAAGLLVGVVDRLDSLVGLFAAGLEPQSTADPYGLRRAALGVIQILVAKNLDVDLVQAVELVAAAQPIDVPTAVRASVIAFIGGRLQSWVEDQAWRPDVIKAVLAAQSSNPARALVGIRELSEWVKRDGWEQLLDGFARCVRITRNESDRFTINPAAFVEDAERELNTAYESAAAKLTAADNVGAFLTAFEPMLPAITKFFDDVLVNADAPAVRQNRLGLLQAISALQAGRADLSHLSGF
ncbi:MAG: glycine--tRNA ligase subunit beta, partial [Chloroflexi bacterium]|nr:glycine--tRNA ligase subunit beta [Chloroflexota bacterium]